MNTEPFALKDRIDPSKDIDERELIRTVNTINDIEDRPRRFLEPGRFDTAAAFRQIKSYQHSRGLKPDSIVRPKGPTEKRIAAEQHKQRSGTRSGLHYQALGRAANVPLASGTGKGQTYSPLDIRTSANALKLAGYEADSTPTSVARNLTTFQRQHGKKPDGIMQPDGPTQRLLSDIVAPQIDLLTGTNPTRPKPWKPQTPSIVARALNDRPSTVRTFEQRGAAAIQLEDQTLPKRCGHLSGKTLVPTEEMCGKVRAAADAGLNSATVIVARTDAIAVEGLDAALDRAEGYLEAGADVLFIEAPRDIEQMQSINQRFAQRVPLLANMVEGGQTPMHTAEELEAMGYAIVIFPGGLVRAFAHMAEDYFSSLKKHGGTGPFHVRMLDITQLNDLLGTPVFLEAGAKYDGKQDG